MAVSNTGSFDAWERNALITVDDGTTAINMQAITETIDIDVGERDYDKIDLLNLGQIAKHGPMGICTVTFEGYPLYAGTPDTSGATRGTPKSGIAQSYWEVFAQKGHMDTSDPIANTITNDTERYRVAILWTDDSIATGTTSAASDATPSITGTATTEGDNDGKLLTLTSGTASGGVYMIVSGTSASVYTLTVGDTPATDTGSATPSDTYTITPTGSGAVTTASAKGKRFVMADCTCVSCKTSFTDGILKQTLVFKGKAFDNSGNGCIKTESAQSGVQLPELGTYVAGTTKWA